MKKIIPLLLCIALSCALLAGCGSSDQSAGAVDPSPSTETGAEGNGVENVVVDPALENEVKVTSDEPYVMK